MNPTAAQLVRVTAGVIPHLNGGFLPSRHVLFFGYLTTQQREKVNTGRPSSATHTLVAASRRSDTASPSTVPPPPTAHKSPSRTARPRKHREWFSGGPVIHVLEAVSRYSQEDRIFFSSSCPPTAHSCPRNSARPQPQRGCLMSGPGTHRFVTLSRRSEVPVAAPVQPTTHSSPWSTATLLERRGTVRDPRASHGIETLA